MSLITATASAQSKLTLNMVSVGVSKFKNNYCKPLGAAHRDGRDMASFFCAQQGKLFSKVNVYMYLNEKATAGNILAGLKAARARANQNTYTILFMASHGGPDAQGKYSFCAHDQQIRWQSIQSVLHNMPGRVIVMLDTCGSGSVSFGGNLTVYSACLSRETSQESARNGYFTAALLEGLQGKADLNHDGWVTLAELDAYVSDRLAKAKQHCTMLRPANVPSSLPMAFCQRYKTGAKTKQTAMGNSANGYGTVAAVHAGTDGCLLSSSLSPLFGSLKQI
jgi:hypothetical protein